MPNNNHKFFCNKNCKFFPCHTTDSPEDFNCLFCYCPLYALGDKCGGNFKYTEQNHKDCSNCLLPHDPDGYEYIISKFNKLSELAKLNGK